MRMAKRLDFGCVWINTHIPLVAEMPHGGFKHSGYGKDLSIRLRRLHAHQARDGEHRLTAAHLGANRRHRAQFAGAGRSEAAVQARDGFGVGRRAQHGTHRAESAVGGA